jgi:hypothetical protein
VLDSGRGRSLLNNIFPKAYAIDVSSMTKFGFSATLGKWSAMDMAERPING